MGLYLHLQSMDPFRRKKYKDLEKDGKLNNDQKVWDLDHPPEIIPGHPDEFKIKGADDKDVTLTIDDQQWDELYAIFSNVFQSFENNKNGLSKKTLDFLKEYYNENPTIGLFYSEKTVAVSPVDKVALADILDNYTELFGTSFKTIDEQKNFASALRAGSAIPDFNTKMQTLLQEISQQARMATAYEDSYNPFGNKQSALAAYRKASALFGKFGQNSIDKNHRNRFKKELVKRPGGLLEKLFSNGKTFGADFAKRGGGRITGILDAVKTENDFTAGDNIIPGKDNDVKTRFNENIDKIKEKLDASIGKLTSRHKREIYDHGSASDIVAAIIAKAKKTDGLEAVLKAEADIKAKVLKSNPGAAGDFSWFISQLKELQDQMPNAFAGALSSGRQMNAIIKHMVVNAAKSGNKPKCMVAMEVLSVLQYDSFSSKIRDGLFNEKSEWTFASGIPSLKDKPVLAGMAKAFDWTIKQTARGVFEAANLLKNRISKRGRKFKKKDLVTARNNIKLVQDDFDFDAIMKGTMNWSVDDAESARDAADAVLRDKKKDLADKKAEIAAKEAEVNTARNALGGGKSLRELRSDKADAAARESSAADSVREITRQLKDFKDFEKGGGSLSMGETKQKNSLKDQKKQAAADKRAAKKDKAATDNLLATPTNEQTALEDRETELDALEQEHDNLKAEVNIAESDFQIKDFIYTRKKEPSEKADKELSDIHEMMQYWNFKNNIGERIKRNDLNIFQGKAAHDKKQDDYNKKNNNKSTNDTLVQFHNYMKKQNS
jgi:hypothetical protein